MLVNTIIFLLTVRRVERRVDDPDRFRRFGLAIPPWNPMWFRVVVGCAAAILVILWNWLFLSGKMIRGTWAYAIAVQYLMVVTSLWSSGTLRERPD